MELKKTTQGQEKKAAAAEMGISFTIVQQSYFYTILWLKPVMGIVVWEVILEMIQGYFPKHFSQRGSYKVMLVR